MRITWSGGRGKKKFAWREACFAQGAAEDASEFQGENGATRCNAGPMIKRRWLF